jgi:hypothetical protein
MIKRWYLIFSFHPLFMSTAERQLSSLDACVLVCFSRRWCLVFSVFVSLHLPLRKYICPQSYFFALSGDRCLFYTLTLSLHSPHHHLPVCSYHHPSHQPRTSFPSSAHSTQASAPSTTYFPSRSYRQHSSIPYTTSPSRQHLTHARTHTQPKPQHPHNTTQSSKPRPLETAMASPSTAFKAQAGCPLFKLAAETRNQIYELVFTIETNEDGHVELSKATAPSNALAGTCQQIYNESRAMFESMTYDYPWKYYFTINVPDRHQRPTIPALLVSQKFFDSLDTFRITWRADELSDNNPLHLTSFLNRMNGDRDQLCNPSHWDINLEVNVTSWKLIPRTSRQSAISRLVRIKFHSRHQAPMLMGNLYPTGRNCKGRKPSDMFASASSEIVYSGVRG